MRLVVACEEGIVLGVFGMDKHVVGGRRCVTWMCPLGLETFSDREIIW